LDKDGYDSTNCSNDGYNDRFHQLNMAFQVAGPTLPSAVKP
jgi:hypothetical protein